MNYENRKSTMNIYEYKDIDYDVLHRAYKEDGEVSVKLTGTKAESCHKMLNKLKNVKWSHADGKSQPGKLAWANIISKHFGMAIFHRRLVFVNVFYWLYRPNLQVDTISGGKIFRFYQ